MSVTKSIPEWKKKEMEKADMILAEIVATNAFREDVRRIIAEGEEETKERIIQLGIKRAVFEIALDNFLDDEDVVEQSPTLVKALLEDIESAIEAETPGRWKDVKDHIARYSKIEISIDLSDIMEDESKPVEEALKRKLDEWVEETAQEIEKEAK